jgi:hypothetical protein
MDFWCCQSVSCQEGCLTEVHCTYASSPHERRPCSYIQLSCDDNRLSPPVLLPFYAVFDEAEWILSSKLCVCHCIVIY